MVIYRVPVDLVGENPSQQRGLPFKRHRFFYSELSVSFRHCFVGGHSGQSLGSPFGADRRQ
uniref:Uncharacterized protein n=1 Tax=Vitis vinifera TaxID=29760 RepID=F6I5G8_VITVI